MRILILTKKFPYPLKDGEAIAIFNLIKGFSNLGHGVTALSINTIKHHFDIQQLPTDVKALADFHEVTVDTSPTYGGALGNLLAGTPYHVDRFISEAYRQKLRELLNNNKYDLIQCEGLFLGPYLDDIRQLSKAPVVLRAHNVEAEIWGRMAANQANPLKRWYIGLQAKRLGQYEVTQLNRYDAIVPITDDDGRKLKTLGANKPMHTTPAGIDLTRFDGYDRFEQIPNTVFFIGGLDWLPNQEGLQWFLQNVWPKVYQQNPQWQFHIAGRNMPDWLRQLKAEGVQVLGEVDSAVEFMARRQIMVVPLLSGSGMRIKIVEGMAVGKPIVATTVGAEGIEYTNGKDILIADAAEAFTQQVLQLMANPTQANNVGKNARQLIESKYDNGKFAAKLIEFYRSQFGL